MRSGALELACQSLPNVTCLCRSKHELYVVHIIRTAPVVTELLPHVVEKTAPQLYLADGNLADIRKLGEDYTI